MWGAIALGTGVWWFSRYKYQKSILTHAPVNVNRGAVEQAIAQAESRLKQLQFETAVCGVVDFSSLQERLANVKSDLGRCQLNLIVAGGSDVGKTALVTRLRTDWLPCLPDASVQSVSICDAVDALFVSENTNRQPSSLELEADAILFVVAGDLTQPEFEFITRLVSQNQRVIVIFNKADQYLPSERVLVLQQIQQRLTHWLPPQDVIAISTVPSPIKVRQHQSDGSVQEWVEQALPDLTMLNQRLNEVLTQDGAQLILAATLRKAIALNVDIQQQLNRLRRDRALPLIEQFQWIAAATAFANPVASLDLVATAAINTQLVLDLGALYQQPLSVEQAKTAAGNLAKLMVKLGLVELSTQAISPLLKSNALTFVAGGLLQGISAAYLTRVVGLSLVEYFEERSQHMESSAEIPLRVEHMKEALKSVFRQNQQPAFLATLVKQGTERLLRQNSSQPVLSAPGRNIAPISSKHPVSEANLELS